MVGEGLEQMGRAEWFFFVLRKKKEEDDSDY